MLKFSAYVYLVFGFWEEHFVHCVFLCHPLCLMIIVLTAHTAHCWPEEGKLRCSPQTPWPPAQTIMVWLTCMIQKCFWPVHFWLLPTIYGSLYTFRTPKLISTLKMIDRLIEYLINSNLNRDILIILCCSFVKKKKSQNPIFIHICLY